ncbi:MAG: L-2-amino-thiazoline-4-carboxylic acid hydrolase [Gemmatimonadota bacterium]
MSLPSDAELNAIGVLNRRLIEARILAPMLQAFAAEVGEARALAIVREVVTSVARRQGAELADAAGGDSLAHFAGTLDHWTADDALHLEVLDAPESEFAFNVTRCRYAEMYRELGIPELGAILSCSRDAALIDGFNPGVELERTQTIMGGASHCDFRYSLRRAKDTP